MNKYILICLSIFFSYSLSAQSYKVIVNMSNSASSISKNEVSDLLLKKTTKWPDGTKVTPIDQKSGSVKSAFSSDILGKSEGAVKAYWQQYVFSGKGTPPLEKGSDSEIIDFVKSTPGAIGYVSSNADITGVKILTVN